QFRNVPAGPDWPLSGVLRVRVEEARDAAALARELRDRLPPPAPPPAGGGRAAAALARELRDRLDAGAPLPSGEDVSHQRGRLVLHVRDRADLARAEQTIRGASYKDTDNTLAAENHS